MDARDHDHAHEPYPTGLASGLFQDRLILPQTRERDKAPLQPTRTVAAAAA